MASAQERRGESRAEEKAVALGTTLRSRQRGRHHKEAPGQIQTEGHSTKYLPCALNTAEVIKNKEGLRNGHRSEEAKETGRLTVVSVSDGILEQKRTRV